MIKPLNRLNRLLQVDRKDITQVYVYALFNGLVNLSLPLGIQAIINLIQGGEVSTSWIVLVSFVIFGIALTGLLQLLQLRIVENIAQKIFSRASFEFAYRIPRIRSKELHKYYAPELANRFFDTLTIQKGLPKILIDFSLAAFQIVVGILVLSMYHPFFVIFGIILVMLVYVIFMITGPKGISTSLEESKYKYEIAHWLEEIARARLSFKLVGDQDIALRKTDENVSKYLKARESHFKVLVRQFLHLIGFKVLIAAGLLIIGGLLVFDQEMNIGQFVAAEIIIILIINSVEKLIKSLDSIYDVLTALEKIGKITDMELDQDDGYSLEADLTGMQLSLRKVGFTFPNSDDAILHDVTLEMKEGSSLCIMGSSGAGKSTLMHLCSGILDPTEGVIEFNGLSMQSIDYKVLRKNVGYALSNNQIFIGTFMENILMGRPDISTQRVLEVCEMLTLTDFIGTLSDGLNTTLDPEGHRVPRSVVNKIILARAIVNSPKFLILEDPLDHVQKEEKEDIIKAITDSRHGWSIMVTTVDPLWNKYIPNHVYMDKGRITANNKMK